MQTTISNLIKMQKSCLKGRKHCEKRRNCSLRAISPILTEFSKDLYCRHVKNTGLFGNVLINFHFSLRKGFCVQYARSRLAQRKSYKPIMNRPTKKKQKTGNLYFIHLCTILVVFFTGWKKKNCMFIKLTLCQTIPAFNNPEKENL